MKLFHHKRNLLLPLFVLFLFFGIYMFAIILNDRSRKLTLSSQAVEPNKCVTTCDPNNPKGGCPCKIKAPWCASGGYLCDQTANPPVCQLIGSPTCPMVTSGETVGRQTTINKGTDAGNDCYLTKETIIFGECAFGGGVWYRCVGPDVSGKGDYNNLKEDGACNEAHPDKPYLPPKLSNAISDLIKDVAIRTNFSPVILKTIMWIESVNTYYFMNDKEVKYYSQPNIKLPNCLINECSAAGPMQMTTGTRYFTIGQEGDKFCTKCCSYFDSSKCINYCPDAWAGILEELKTYTSNPHPCNLKDNITASSLFVKKETGVSGNTLSKEQVENIAFQYYGACGSKTRRLGNLDYCEYMWESYKSE